MIIVTVRGRFIVDRCRVSIACEDVATAFAWWCQQQGYVVEMEEVLEQHQPARSPHELEVAAILTRQFAGS